MYHRKGDCYGKVDYWLNSLQARVKNVPVLIVGTHLDLYQKVIKDKKRTKGRKMADPHNTSSGYYFFLFLN